MKLNDTSILFKYSNLLNILDVHVFIFHNFYFIFGHDGMYDHILQYERMVEKRMLVSVSVSNMLLLFASVGAITSS